jgi:hypothetical protein
MNLLKMKPIKASIFPLKGLRRGVVAMQEQMRSGKPGYRNSSANFRYISRKGQLFCKSRKTKVLSTDYIFIGGKNGMIIDKQTIVQFNKLWRNSFITDH